MKGKVRFAGIEVSCVGGDPLICLHTLLCFYCFSLSQQRNCGKKSKKSHLYLHIPLVLGGISNNLKQLKYILVVRVWSQVVGTLMKLIRKDKDCNLTSPQPGAEPWPLRCFLSAPASQEMPLWRNKISGFWEALHMQSSFPGWIIKEMFIS